MDAKEFKRKMLIGDIISWGSIAAMVFMAGYLVGLVEGSSTAREKCMQQIEKIVDGVDK